MDFYDNFLIRLEPHKLIYLTTGNISNKKLLQLFNNNFELIIEKIELNQVIEITDKSIITIL